MARIKQVIDFLIWPTPIVGVGGFCIFVVGALVGRGIDSRVVEFLDRWQTLVAGGIAGFAALGTIYVLRVQINQAEDQFARKSSLERLAKRNMMVHHLGNISEYIRGVLNIYALHFSESNERSVAIPKIPMEDLRYIANLAALYSSSHKDVAETIKNLVQRLQYLSARLEGVLTGRKSYMVENYCEFLYCRALNDSLYEFARFQTEVTDDTVFYEAAYKSVGVEGDEKIRCRRRINENIEYYEGNRKMRSSFAKLKREDVV